MSRSLCTVYTSFILICITLLVAGAFQTLIHKHLKREITLTEGSKVFGTLKNPPPPVFMEFFFYNVTNPDEFLDGAKPQVTTVGPYTYRSKDIVTFMEDGTKVSAVTPKTFVFVHEMSVGDPSEDSVTTVNIPAVAVMNKVKDLSFLARMGMYTFMGSLGTTMFMTRTVEELLWGFKDPLLTRLHDLKPEVDEYFGLMLNTTGELLRVNKGVQINIQLNRVTGFPMTRNLNGTIFPVMFYNETFIIDDASAELLSINPTAFTPVTYTNNLFTDNL